MTLEKDFTLSEDELKVIREAIKKTMAEYLANQKWLDGQELYFV